MECGVLRSIRWMATQALRPHLDHVLGRLGLPSDGQGLREAGGRALGATDMPPEICGGKNWALG